MKTKIALVIVVILIGIQFFRPAKNISAAPNPKNITAHFQTSPQVKHILQVACYDCHSDNTRYPWYSHVEPIGWWLASHINEGKHHLNFSEFTGYGLDRQAKKMQGVIRLVEHHHMPLKSYLLIHTDARLSEAQTKELVDWAKSVRAQLIKEGANPSSGHEHDRS